MLHRVCNPDNTKNNPGHDLYCHSKDKDLQLWRGLVYVKTINTLLKYRICDNCGNS